MKNVVICCDGTGNEIEANLSNVLKLYRTLEKSAEQLVFYDAGVGTLSSTGPWSRVKSKAKAIFGLATGQGLDQNILDAYEFLIDHYQEGDRVYLFGFSRGAYTVRALAGFIRLVGILRPEQRNLMEFALRAYKQSAEKGELEIAWRFSRVTSARHIPIHFLGLWDTVSSVLVPRFDRLLFVTLQKLPYTARNELVRAVRHAIAIDEKRRLFRLNRWIEGQKYKTNIFDRSKDLPDQDVQQVWFAGVHSDVGGGYAENESGLAKHALQWMIDEAGAHQLIVKSRTYSRLVLGRGQNLKGPQYVAPDSNGKKHKSLTIVWWIMEIFPKRIKWREWKKWRPWIFWLYFPLGEPRHIPEDALIHGSVKERLADPKNNYAPVNLPKNPKYLEATEDQ